MDTLRKLLYTGTGCHFQPVNDFPNTKEFIFIECQPYSEFSGKPFFDRGFYRDNFVEKVLNRAKSYEFELIEEKELDNTFFWSKLTLKQKICYTIFPRLIPQYVNPTLLKFENKNTNQIIKYFISTPFHYYNNNEVTNEIESCDGLILSGFFPNKSILEYFPNKKISFIGYTGSYFGFDEEVEDYHDLSHVVRYMHEIKEEERTNYFDKYYLVNDVIDKYLNEESIIDTYGIDYHTKYENLNKFIIENKPKSDIIECSSFDNFLIKINN